MKLLVISREFPPYVQGGISYHLKYLYQKLCGRGHDITVIAGKPRSIEECNSVRINENISVDWLSYPSPTAYHIQFPIVLKKHLMSFPVTDYDIALTHAEVPFQLDIPTIFKVHDAKQKSRYFMRNDMNSVSRLMDTIINPSRKFVDRNSISNSDYIIFNSNLTREIWMSNYSVDVPSSVIHNGVDLNKFSPAASNDAGISTHREQRYLLFVGDTERKGISRIERMAKESPYPIHVVGSTEPKSTNTKYIGRLTQHELIKQYQSAYATIHPAKFEAFGNIILESLACGTPVIVSENCGASEIIDESCGAITTDLSAGIDNIENIERQSCRDRAENYSWELVAKRTESIIRKLV